MAKQLQLRRGTTVQHNTFTGAVGEVTIDTDKDVVVVHDGATAGGFPSQKELVSGTNIKTVNSTTLLGSGNIAVQETLVSGTNIKTINNSTILGSGNIDVVSAGMITGGTTNQVLAKNSSADYDTKWYSVQPTLVSGTNIKTINSSSILASGNLDLVDKVSSTDNAIVRFDGTSGAVQNSSVVIDDSGNVGIGTSSPLSALHTKISTGATINAIATFEGVGNGEPGRGIGFNFKVPTLASSALGAQFNVYTEDASNNTAIALVTAKNGTLGERMRIDSSGNVGINVTPSYKLHLVSDSAAKPSTNTWTISSDERLKENIELADLDRCYEIVKTIPLKRYTWKDSVYTQEQVSDRSKLGWIANDVQTVFPKAVNTHSQQLATFKIELKDVEEQKLISEAIPAQEEIKDEDGNIIQEFIEAKEAVYETIIVQKEEKVYDVLDDCLDLNSDQIYAVMYGAIQKLQLTVESLKARIEALEAK